MKRILLVVMVALLILHTPLQVKAQNLIPGDDIKELTLVEATNFSDNRAFMYIGFVGRNNRYCVDTNGRVVFKIPDNMDIKSEYVNGLAYAVLEKERVMIDLNGKIVIAPEIQGFDRIEVGIVYYESYDEREMPKSYYYYVGNPNQQDMSQDKRAENVQSRFSVLKAGYIIVSKNEPSFQGDRYSLGVLNTQGNWVMPLNESCGTQEQIKHYFYITGPLMIGSLIHAGHYKDFALDLNTQTIFEVDPDDSFRLKLEDWQYYVKEGYSHLYYKEDATIALHLNEQYPTMVAGSDFFGEYAALYFDGGSQEFVGIINKKGELMFEPIPVADRHSRFNMISEDKFFVLDPVIEKRVNVYSIKGSLLFSIDNASSIHPYSNGLARVENAVRSVGSLYTTYCSYIDENGTIVIGNHE